jgi:nucleotide-binding universal stress UspA family protein
MGTHGVNGFNEYFLGSNAHKTVSVCPCPVITIQTKPQKLGYENIVLPIDDCLHSREKVNYTIALAKKFASKIHVIGLLDSESSKEPNKFMIKLESVEKALDKSKLNYTCEILKGNNPALITMKYAKKTKADLIVVLNDHESDLTNTFFGAFAKKIVNHSKIPVMSIKPAEPLYDSVSLAGSNSN